MSVNIRFPKPKTQNLIPKTHHPKSNTQNPKPITRYLYYGFLGLFSFGFLCLIGGLLAGFLVYNHYQKDLPDYEQLKDYSPSVVTRLYAGDGSLMSEYAKQKRVFVPETSIPDIVKQAFISAEDQNFYKHRGVDYKAVVRAALSNLRNAGTGRRPEGASTITQQVAKNFLLTNEVSYERKLKEAILAYRIEKAYSKEKLLELYLNEIYLGAGTYGVAAAGLYYFNKSMDELELYEIAYLAALPKAPNNYHPTQKTEAAIARRNWVLGRMYSDGYITKEQRDEARQQPLETIKRNDNSIDNVSYFSEEVRRELFERYGETGLYQSGLSVRTSVNPVLQDIAIKALRDGLMAYDKRHGYRGRIGTVEDLENWQSALDEFERPAEALKNWRIAAVLSSGTQKATIGLKNGTQGLVRLDDLSWARKSLDQGYALGAAVTSVSKVLKKGDIILVERKDKNNDETEGIEKPDYLLRQMPLIQGAIIAIDPHTGRVLAMQGGWKYDGSEFNRATQAKRQPGSAFKPFVYLAALDKGFTPATLVVDGPIEYEDRPGNIWKPTNYSNEFYGPTPIRVGLEKSRNLMTVRLADYVGMENIADYAKRFGVTQDMSPLLANALGADETTLYDITAAYAVFVNGGRKIWPTFIDRIQDRWGETVFRHDNRPCPNCGNKIQWVQQETPAVPDTRLQIADSRSAYQVVSMMEGVVQRGTGIRLRSINRPIAGKTGTTNESRDAWFIGFTPDLVVGVFTGFDEPRSLGLKETGSSVALPIFKAFMEEALKDRPPVPFRIPQGIRNVQINASTGTRAKFGDENVIWESFKTGTEPTSDVYILDETGITVMSEDYLYEPQYDQQFDIENYIYQQPERRTISTGTGGIY